MHSVKTETQPRKVHLLTDAEKLASYRIVRSVTHAVVYGRGNCYPICPRCKQAIDREYIRFCNNCGQHLGWQSYSPPKSNLPGKWRACK